MIRKNIRRAKWSPIKINFPIVPAEWWTGRKVDAALAAWKSQGESPPHRPDYSLRKCRKWLGQCVMCRHPADQTAKQRFIDALFITAIMHIITLAIQNTTPWLNITSGHATLSVNSCQLLQTCRLLTHALLVNAQSHIHVTKCLSNNMDDDGNKSLLWVPLTFQRVSPLTKSLKWASFKWNAALKVVTYESTREMESLAVEQVITLQPLYINAF